MLHHASVGAHVDEAPVQHRHGFGARIVVIDGPELAVAGDEVRLLRPRGGGRKNDNRQHSHDEAPRPHALLLLIPLVLFVSQALILMLPQNSHDPGVGQQRLAALGHGLRMMRYYIQAVAAGTRDDSETLRRP